MSMPMAISAALRRNRVHGVQMVMTKNHLGTVTSANPGSIRTTCGTIEAK